MSQKAEDRIVVTDGEKVTPLWQKLMKHWQARLDKLYIHLSRDLTEQETAKIRGQIAELRACLNLGKAQPKVDE